MSKFGGVPVQTQGSRFGGIPVGQASRTASRLEADDAARKKANQEAPWYEQLGTGIKTQAGRTMLGAYELANNLTGDRLFDPEILAEAQREADRSDAGTGAAGFVGNLVGDVRNFVPLGSVTRAKTLGQAVKQGAKVGGLTGALSGATEGTGDEDSGVFTNAGNALLGGVLGGALGGFIPVAATGAKKGADLAQGGLSRALAFAGSDKAAENVAYRNAGRILAEQGYAPGEVASILDEFKSQGIAGGTLGQMLESSDLLAREKNLLQGGKEAGRIMGEKLKEQPRKIADSVVAKMLGYAQPEQTSYLYGQAASLADALAPLPMDEASRMARAKEMGFTVDAYHGTANDFPAFDRAKTKMPPGGSMGPGFYFADSPVEASGYASEAAGKAGSPSVLPVRLKLRNPLDIEAVLPEETAAKLLGPGAPTPTSRTGMDIVRAMLLKETQGKARVTEAETARAWEAVYEKLKAAGFDGLKYADAPSTYWGPRHARYVAFDPSQVRSRFAAFNPAEATSPNLIDTAPFQSATQRELPQAWNAIDQALTQRGDELPPAVLKRIQRIVAQAKTGGFEAADTAKKQLDDLYKANSATADQDIVNDVVLGLRRTLNDALEAAGGDTYTAAKESALRDMAAQEVTDAMKGTRSVRTALNKFFATPEQQEEFLRKLPNRQARDEFQAYLANLEKVAGRFGGSDTASNTATQKTMNAETGLGFDTNLNPLNALDRVTAPLQRRVRTAQAEMTFSPDANRLGEAMQKRGPANVPAAIPRVLATEQAKGAVQTQPGEPPPVTSPVPTIQAPPAPVRPSPRASRQLLQRIALAESSGNPNARNPNSTASGLYQITDDTWARSVAKWGKELGVGLKDKGDPAAQEAVMGKLLADNARMLKKSLGREPTDGDLYVAHFLGADDARKLINAQGTGRDAVTLFPRRVVAANRTVFFDRKRPRTVEEVYATLTGKVS